MSDDWKDVTYNEAARTLSPEEEAVIKELYERKAKRWTADLPTHAYVTTTRPIKMRKWNGQHPPEDNMKECEVPANTTLKIVMVSRFGDCGLTDDLSAENGYHIRLEFEDSAITNLRWKP